jgi:hypothetical protein
MHEDWPTVEVDAETIKYMVLFGLARRAEDGIHELTESGSQWLQDWCAKKMRAAKEI